MARITLASALLASLILAGCGGGGSGGGTVTPTAPTPTATPGSSNPASMPSTGTVASSTVYVGQNGHTLYLLSADSANTSTCTATGGCTGIWPPYTAPAGTTAPASGALGIMTRSDSTLQWTLNSMPLYEYSGDSAGGTANGQGIVSFGGTWTAAQPAASGAGPNPSPVPYTMHR